MDHFKLYGFTGSGNCEKVRMVADILGLDYDWIEVPIFDGASRTENYLDTVNPGGQVPAITFATGRALSQSNAIMLYLAEGSTLIPPDPFDRAQMYSWLFWEQYTHEPAIAVRRALIQYRGMKDADIDPALTEKGQDALALMERTLHNQKWFAGYQFSLADIALYAYTHVAPEGGFSLQPYETLRRWLDRTAEQLNG